MHYARGTVNDIARTEHYEQALGYALRILSRKAYTAHEVRSKLVERDVPEELIAPLMSELAEYNLINDEQYAGQYTRTHQATRGPVRIEQELTQRGVAPEHIARAMKWLRAHTNFVANATAALEERAWRYEPSPGSGFREVVTAKNRARDFLLRRGYETETIEVVLKKTGWF